MLIPAIIANWLARNKERAYIHEFENGFGWVMTDRFLYNVPLESIAKQIDNNFGAEPIAFDDGALKAFALLTEIENGED